MTTIDIILVIALIALIASGFLIWRKVMTFDESVAGVAQSLAESATAIETAIKALPSELSQYTETVKSNMIMPGTPLGDMLTSITDSGKRLLTVANVVPLLIPTSAAQLADSFTFTGDITAPGTSISNISHEVKEGQIITSDYLPLGTKAIADAAIGGELLLDSSTSGTGTELTFIANAGNPPAATSPA